MNHLEAKLILQAYRPNGVDASDPLFREALEQVDRDPELKKWFANEMALETLVQSRLEEAVEVPRNLKASLLALRKPSEAMPWWLRPMKLTAAGVFAIFVIVTLLIVAPHHHKSDESFRQSMALRSLERTEHVTFEPRNLPQIEEWLQRQGVSTNFDLPRELQDIGAQGCRVVEWNHQKVAMICFVSKNGGEHFDLFVVDNSGNASVQRGESPLVETTNGLMTALWSKGNKVYLLTGKNADELRRVIRSI